MKKYKAGIIGCGQIAGGYNNECLTGASLTHVCSYQQIDQVDLVAVCDPDLSAREYFGKKWGVENLFSSSSEMLYKFDLDIVSICSPTEYHLDAFKNIAKTSSVKGIFCEKPISYDLQEAYNIVNLSKGRSVSLNYFRRWNLSLRELCKDLKNHKYGKVLSIHARYTKGILVNGSHLVDILCWFFGVPIDIKTFHIHTRYDEDPGVDFRLKFASDIEATFLHIPDVPYVYINIDLFTEKGKLTISQRGQKIEWYHSVTDTDYNTFNKLDLLTTEETQWRDCPTRALIELLNVMEHGGEISCTLEDGIRVSEVCEKIINY